MDTVSLFLLVIAGIFVIGILGEMVFDRTGIPDVVWLIAVGLLLGPITGFVSRDHLQSIAPYFGALTLVIVLFDGGSELKLGDLSQAAGRGVSLALMSFLASVAVLAPVAIGLSRIGVFPEGWSWIHGIMLAAIVGGSSSVVVMPALSKAKIPDRIANMVKLESALTDVLCVVVTGACIDLIVSGATDVGAAAATLGRAFGIGIAVGGAAGMISLLVLRRVRKSSHAYPMILGTLLVIYVLIHEMGGSAALGILTVAVIVGNARSLGKVFGLAPGTSLAAGVNNTHDQFTFIVKSFLFRLHRCHARSPLVVGCRRPGAFRVASSGADRRRGRG